MLLKKGGKLSDLQNGLLYLIWKITQSLLGGEEQTPEMLKIPPWQSSGVWHRTEQVEPRRKHLGPLLRVMEEIASLCQQNAALIPAGLAAAGDSDYLSFSFDC